MFEENTKFCHYTHMNEKGKKKKLDRLKVKEYVYHYEKVKLEKQEHLYQIKYQMVRQVNQIFLEDT